MINVERFNEILVEFKKDFPGEHWKGEKYKWKAVKCFQDNWDIDAPDFLEMFLKATSKTYNLLASMRNYPRAMIKAFAEKEPETVKSMFIDLYDESVDLSTRVEKFVDESEKLREKYDDGTWKNHYQGPNPISTYLWLRYPDKYYIYKYSEYKATALKLGSEYSPTIGKKKTIDSFVGGKKLYDEVCELLQKDDEMKAILKSVLTEDCYDDPYLKTLTIDFGFYISRYLDKASSATDKDGWWPSLEYFNPNLSKDDWKKYILEIEKPNHPVPMQMLKAMLELNGEASCKELADKFGGTPSAYIGCTTSLGRRVKSYFNLSACMDGTQERYFPFPFYGKSDDKNYVYKMRPELMQALSEIDLSDVSPYYREGENEVNYWFLNANPRIWSFSSLAVGEEQDYTLYNDNGNKRRVFQNFLDARVGDIIVGYESTPVKQIVALGKVSAEQDGEKIYFEKTENLANPIDYAMLKEAPQLQNMEYFVSPQGSLFKLTNEEFECIMDLIREENPIAKQNEYELYDKEKFLSEVYMTEERYHTLVHLLDNKMNVILQGAPGVGKTFTAKRLAYSIMGEKDDSRIELVQFHQNYSYEDFIMGYKPAGEGFELKNGIFYRFCQKAASYPNKKFFFIIDEINRGNISKILGELMMLIEKDYRGTTATLAYNGLPFSVPDNLYIIGMMNTADRSLAMIDYALRRRFSFFDVVAGFNSKGFKKYQQAFESDTFNDLIDRIVELNKEIASDTSLGSGFCIGHSYFCGQKECTDEWLREVVEYDIIPMLTEYWFDDKATLQRWENNLRGVFNV
ncbi:MAG: EVE domain-containing protein [Ruminococcus sp.]|nr:EVE domain-containing protein [Ruminococcus sp.]